MMIKNPGLQKKRGSRPPKYIWLIGGVLLVVLTLGALEWSGTINLFGYDKPTSGTIPSQSQGSSSSDKDGEDKDDDSSTPVVPAPQSPKQDPPPTNQSGEAPRAPSGNFVSNHHPSVSNRTDAPSSVSSACTTTPGAACRIEFTNNAGVVKELKNQVTDSNGETSWDWDINQAGFSPGSWKIKAIATLNGKTTSAEDIQSFEVEP